MASASTPQSWDTPDLYHYKDIKDKHPLYDRGGLLAKTPPDDLSPCLPTANPHDPSLPLLPPSQSDVVFVGIDFEELCKYKVGTYTYGPNNTRTYRYKPVTEAGLTWFDTREIMNKSPAVAPGDRGLNWYKSMKDLHFIIEEYRSHWGDICQVHSHISKPYLFAWGKSRTITEQELSTRLARVHGRLKTSNLTDQEKTNGDKRTLIFVTWDSTLIESTISRLGLDWFSDNDELWDLRCHKYWKTRRVGSRAKMEHAMEALGLRFLDNSVGNICHCAGNDAVFLLQMLLALHYMTDEQKGAFMRAEHMPWLPFTWTGQPIDQCNIPPGETATHRPADKMNDNGKDQVRDPKIYSGQDCA